jgi:hypothetical protein
MQYVRLNGMIRVGDEGKGKGRGDIECEAILNQKSARGGEADVSACTKKYVLLGARDQSS